MCEVNLYHVMPGMAVLGAVLVVVLVIIHRTQTNFSTKKFLKKNIHFLHPFRKTPLYAMLFGCRIGCRITSFGVGLV